MVAFDVVAREAEQLLVVGAFEVVPAGAVNRSHPTLRPSCGIVLARHREPPFGPAVLQASCRASGRAQAAHRLVRVRAEGSTAVGDDLTIGGQLGETLLELVDRDR